uniref:Uncharacterized protein n=1 Tax=Setaria digitata TaxID=48799 RepID=A0A915PEF7_9BILA
MGRREIKGARMESECLSVTSFWPVGVNYFVVISAWSCCPEPILMSQKRKTLGTVTECTEICDDSVSLLDDASFLALNTPGFLIAEECGEMAESDERDKGRWIHAKPSRLNFASLFHTGSHRKYKSSFHIKLQGKVINKVMSQRSGRQGNTLIGKLIGVDVEAVVVISS